MKKGQRYVPKKWCGGGEGFSCAAECWTLSVEQSRTACPCRGSVLRLTCTGLIASLHRSHRKTCHQKNDMNISNKVPIGEHY